MSKNRGFTLVELMIVVVIVAVLAAIAYPSYQEQIRKTRRAQAKSDLMEITQALERKFTADRSYSTPAFTWPFTTSPRDAAAGSQYYDVAFVGAPTATTYTITATPVNTQASDRCGTLSINYLGQKLHSEGTDDVCGWGTTP